MKTNIVGIINLSPESQNNQATTLDDILLQAERLLIEGADWIDIGAQSTRPGSIQLSASEEFQRVHGVIASIKNRFPSAQISIDTTRSEVALLAVHEGATMINDISGGRFDPEIIEVAKKSNALFVVTHSKGVFTDMHQRYTYPDVISEIKESFEGNLENILSKGINREQIILDPGIGFSKSGEQNIEIIKNLTKLHELNLPLYIGLSRKKFIGTITKQENPEGRDNGTTVFHILCLQKGVSYLRTHNVKHLRECRDILSLM